jgi:hypothetical protein
MMLTSPKDRAKHLAPFRRRTIPLDPLTLIGLATSPPSAKLQGISPDANREPHGARWVQSEHALARKHQIIEPIIQHRHGLVGAALGSCLTSIRARGARTIVQAQRLGECRNIRSAIAWSRDRSSRR